MNMLFINLMLFLKIKCNNNSALNVVITMCRCVCVLGCSVLSDSLWPHGLQHARLHHPSLSPRVCSNSCPSSLECQPGILSSVIPFFFLPAIFPSIGVFANESSFCTGWPEYWSFSFSISPSKEYSGLISFRIDWFDLLASKGLSRAFSNTTVQIINSSVLNFP